MKLHALTFLLILGLCSNQTFAADGCLRNSNGQLYRTKSGSYYKTTSPVANPHATYCIRLSSSTTCYIKSGNNYYPGKLVTYVPPIGCPIDDYVYVLMLLAGCVGYWFLSKKEALSLLKAKQDYI